MPDEKRDSTDASLLRDKVLSRWENEGGAGTSGPATGIRHAGQPAEVPPLTNAELSQLHIRVIALEGLVTALLAEASQRERFLAREMATYISPRPGFTDHPLTIRAATQMIDLVERADRFRAIKPS